MLVVYLLAGALVIFGLFKLFRKPEAVRKAIAISKIQFEEEITAEDWSTHEVLLGQMINDLRAAYNVKPLKILKPEKFLYIMSGIRMSRIIRNFLIRDKDPNIQKKHRLTHADFGLITIIMRTRGIKREGENLAYGHSSYINAFRSWVRSKNVYDKNSKLLKRGHYENMLDEDWTIMSIKIVKHPDRARYFYLALFARPNDIILKKE